MVTKPQLEAREILSQLHKHDAAHGGYLIAVTGGMGQFKTGTLLLFMEHVLDNYKEKVFFSEAIEAPLQVIGKIPKRKIQFFVQKDSGIKFRNRETNKIIDDLKEKTFTDYKDLWKKSKVGQINIPFFKERLDWMEFIAYLRKPHEWVHVYIDEFAEIAPAWERGEPLKRIKNFAKTCKDIRKCMMNVMFNTQTISEIDWRIVDKIMCRVYLPGAKVPSKGSRIYQYAVDSLKKNAKKGNCAWIELPGSFGLTRFQKFYEPQKGFNIEATKDW